MPKYFIDSSDGETSEVDDSGLDLSDDEAARRAALDALPDMIRETMPDGDRRTFTVKVRRDDGSVVYQASMALVGEWVGLDETPRSSPAE